MVKETPSNIPAWVLHVAFRIQGLEIPHLTFTFLNLKLAYNCMAKLLASVFLYSVYVKCACASTPNGKPCRGSTY